ncbi:host specificity protein J [Enterobacter asburiae]|uniref:host specificity protein J n=7 Tax=Enterobacter asburiae TaxID=61645 RepID=UPI001F1508F4|nr:phage tail protein [Enterobacter asburiae]
MEAITGSKGGSQKQHTPVEQPDSAQSMARCRMLLALGEGEFAGGLDTTSIFLDGTPLGNADGTMNFENVSWEFRPGTQTQTPIPGFPAVENETTVGVSLTKATPWTRALSNTQIDAVLVRIGIPGLQQQENDGDIVGTTVKYHIDLAVDGGAFSTVMTRTVTEKLSSLYELTHRINLPKASTGWQIRVVRDTDDSTSQMLQNKTQVQAITEVIDARLRYPHTALLYVSFNAKSFNNIPKVSCKPKGRIIRIPSNYDPIARTYSGTWDGTFKWGWTNNPAWIWFDVLTEPRFGLGRRVTAQMLDKWELYRIAQRCDQKVPDGKGGDGTEPRFMFDVYIQSQADAWQVIKDIAAGFNGMTFWGNNMFNVVSDMPADTSKLQILTRASVVGKPVYSSGSEKTRFSSALINFSDPDNHYQDRTTAVMFPDLVKQFKFKQTQITAIGCTRESEAQRRGGWAVYSNSLDRIITLQTGLDGYVYVPGTVFAFADERLSGRVYGGRITGYNAGLKAVTTDRGTSAVAGDTLMIRTRGGTVESRVIQAVNGTQLVVATPFAAEPLPNAVFVIDAGQLRLQYFRVTNLRFDDEENTFTITGAEYNASKYDAVDNNARLDTPPISLIPTGLVNQPTNIVVASYDAVRQGQRVATLTASWDAPVDKNGKPQADVIAYRVQWKRGDNEWVNVPETGLRNIEVPGIFDGDYLVRVRAINSGGTSSLWATSTLTHLKGRAGEVPKPVGLKASEDVVFGINVTWGFPANTGDTLSTELQYSIAADGSNPMLLASVPYPQKLYQQMGLKAGQEFWYQARLVDRTGNESGYTEWVRGQASIDVSDVSSVILEDMKESQTFKDLIESAVDSNAKIAGMADDIKQNADNLELQAQEIAQNAQDIGQVQTSVNELSSTVGEVSSSLSELEQTVATSDTALGQRIDSISVSMDGMTGGVKNSAIAIIQANLAQVATRKTLSASVAGNSAQLDRIDEVIVTEKEATARALLSLQTSVNGNTASINSLSQTVSNYQQTTATQINAITATINGNTAAITTNAQAIANVNGQLSAMYNIKVGVTSNGQYYAAGMGIGVENTPSGMQSQVIFLADRFAVTTAAGNSVALPFVIQNGQTFIRASFIQDGTIENAKIGSYIQSSTWDGTGNVGWHINKSGYAVFNNVTIRGTVYATNGSFKGSVEATTFVGDIANIGVGADAVVSGAKTATRAITFTDSSNSSLAKSALLEGLIYVSSLTGTTVVNITLNINGNIRDLGNINVPSGNTGMWISVRHALRNITANTVTGTITVTGSGTASKSITSPTLTITRGTGSFS